MVVENTTPNRGYQLPHETNDLADDVLRLIAAIMGIDVEIAAMLVAIASKADAEHDHVIANITGLAAALAARQELAQKGEANGYASLGADGKVPSAQLPSALFGALSYQGVWNASTNSPTIPAAAAGNKGYFYKVSVAGTTTVSGINDWQVGDWIVSNGATWDKVDNTDQVLSVAGLQGAIGAVALASALGLGAAPLVPLSSSTSAADFDTLTTPGWFNGLMRGSNANGWGDTSYGHVLTLQYSTVLTQIAFPYVYTDPIRVRWRNSGVWSAWSIIPTASMVNADYLAKAGGAMTGPLLTAASAAGGAGLRIPHGVGPTSPVNGDLWSTNTALMHRSNGTTAQIWDDKTLTLISQADAEAGTSTNWRLWSAQRVKQAITALAPASPVGLYTGSDSNYTNYPIGHYVLVENANAPPARNASATLTNKSGGTAFGIAPDGVTISGTWRHRGSHLYQRVA